MVLLAGTGAGALVFHGATVRLLPALACVGFVLADIVSVPVPGHPGSVLAKLSAQIPARGDAPVQVAFYPFLTPDYGPEYHELAGIARRHGLALVNAGGDENGLSDLSNPQVQDRLRAMGVSFVVVSVPDYVRRREMLDEAHVLLPVDQEGNAVSWLAPEPGELVRLHVIRADIDGSLLLAP